MATAQDIARTVDRLADELATRIDEFVKGREISSGVATSLGGIVEGMVSIRDALLNCNGVPSPDDPVERFRLEEAENRVRVKLTLSQVEAVNAAISALFGQWCVEGGSALKGKPPCPSHQLPFVVPHGARKTSRLLCLSPVKELNVALLRTLEVELKREAGRNAALRIRHVLPVP